MEELLSRALEPHIGPGVEISNLERLPGGASRETFRFSASDRTGRSQQLILRRDFPGRPGPPEGMTLEAAVLEQARRASLEVPAVLVCSTDPALLGTAGMVTEHVDGETIARRILRDDRFSHSRAALVRDCGRFLAGLHSLDPTAVALLPEWDPLGHCWDEYIASGVTSPTFEVAFRWLSKNRPAPSGPKAVVHGDFRLGNLIVNERGLAAVIDWEGVHLGDPLEDLGWLTVKAWRFGGPLPVAGIATYEELLGAYQSGGGRSVLPEALKWWQLFGTLRWGVICLTQASVHLTGAVRSVELAAIGRRVCEQEWDILGLLDADAVTVDTFAEHDTVPPAVLSPEDSELYGIPSSDQLLSAVDEFFRDEVLPRFDGRLQFHARVAANVVRIVEREILLGPAHRSRCRQGLARFGTGSLRQLAEEVRNGEFDDRINELLPFLNETVRSSLAVSNPGYAD